MNMKDIERDIMKEEKTMKEKVEEPIHKLLEDDSKKEKILEATLKLSKKEGMDLSVFDFEDILENLWDYIMDDMEYVPGYGDEYVDKMKDTFYHNRGLSNSKLAKYILDKYLG